MLGIAAFTLIRVRTSLRSQGLGATLARMRRRAADIEDARQPVTSDPYTIMRAVATAAAFLPFRLRCLEQAVAVHSLLRYYGHQSALRIGVTPFGFRAHAWVEVDDIPLGEDVQKLRALRILPIPV
jgi:hypothetical protein